MLPSLIAGGYWAQAPYGIGHYLPPFKCNITLECDGEEWDVVWMVSSVGACCGSQLLCCQGGRNGFSGGWRGFAIDQRLTEVSSVAAVSAFLRDLTLFLP